MATRNRTQEFREFRQFSSGGDGGSVFTDEIEIDIPSHTLPPEWVDIVEGIEKDLTNIKDHTRDLQRRHADRLKVKFDDDEITRQEREIDDIVQQVTTLLRRCENGLKRIATVGNIRGSSLPQQERMVRLNVMRNLATQLQTLSKQFRHAQKDFLMRLKGQESYENEADIFADDNASQPLSIEAAERGFTESEQQQLENYEQQADERHQEIIKIVQSINDLATLFRELSVLVIEQGTILDRIDYNVEQTLVKVKKGTKELVIADEYSKKNKLMKCILCLIFMALLLIGILVIKFMIRGGKHNDDTSSSDVPDVTDP